jgi:hypothetical protein
LGEAVLHNHFLILSFPTCQNQYFAIKHMEKALTNEAVKEEITEIIYS